MTALTIALAIAVPLVYLYVLHWLDLYGTDRPKIVLQCLGWGLVSFMFSFLANRFCIDILGFSRAWVGTHTAPFVEELLKGGILFYLLRKGRISYFVDGAIYGFASGIGFAVIENLRYIQLFPNNPMALVITRDFSSALAHGTATAMTGIALGSFVLSTRRYHSVLALILGLTGAMTLHYVWNIFAFYSPFPQITTEWIMVGVALSGAAIIAATVIWGLGRERQLLRASLGMKVGVSREEASIVQHLDDLDALLQPIKKRFGVSKRDQVAEFLHLEAQLGLKEDLEENITDPTLRAQWAEDIAELERELDAKRRRVGVYVMLFVRSIFPETAWSLWARLAQTLAKRPPMQRNPWRSALASRLGAQRFSPGDGIYRRIAAEIAMRARTASLSEHHLRELPEPMQQCFYWVMKEVHVTVEHVAAGLGHHETHAHAMLTELVDRGFLHRTDADGRTAFRARNLAAPAAAPKPHVWQSLADRKTAATDKDRT